MVTLPTMRPLLLALLLWIPAALRAGGIEFVRVWPGYRDAKSFERISEYFTGKEAPSKEVVQRTQPASRDGFYFLIRIANTSAEIANAKVKLTLIAPDSPYPKTFLFPVAVPVGQTVYDLGLTGKDWAGKKAHPVAWQVQLVSDSGEILTAKESFLWDRPKS